MYFRVKLFNGYSIRIRSIQWRKIKIKWNACEKKIRNENKTAPNKCAIHIRISSTRSFWVRLHFNRCVGRKTSVSVWIWHYFLLFIRRLMLYLIIIKKICSKTKTTKPTHSISNNNANAFFCATFRRSQRKTQYLLACDAYLVMSRCLRKWSHCMRVFVSFSLFFCCSMLVVGRLASSLSLSFQFRFALNSLRCWKNANHHRCEWNEVYKWDRTNSNTNKTKRKRQQHRRRTKTTQQKHILILPSFKWFYNVLLWFLRPLCILKPKSNAQTAIQSTNQPAGSARPTMQTNESNIKTPIDS